MNDNLTSRISALLTETGQAHHKAFEATGGEDPEWPIWYAHYARDRLAREFGLEYTKSQLIYCLMRADLEHQARSPDSDWTEFYAREMVEHCAPSLTPATDTLDVDVEPRNILIDPQHRSDLVDARGRATVPVLRITSPDGDDRWMPESRDIMAYLQKTYG